MKAVCQEVAHYKAGLERNHTQYKIVEELPQADGSMIVKVIKQYNACPVGDYLKQKKKRVACGVNPAPQAARYYYVKE